MINRIRTIRKEKGMTLADLAAACSPPTTPQTVGRLETGMRTLSIDWLNRIAGALGERARAINRDVLVPRSGGRFAFGRLIDFSADTVALLPPGAGQRQIVVREPAWIALAALLVRAL